MDAETRASLRSGRYGSMIICFFSIVRLQTSRFNTDYSMSIRMIGQEDTEFQEIASVDIKLDSPGNTRIAINHKYLQDVSEAIPGIVELLINDPAFPMMFQPADDPNYIVVQMPMFVKWEEDPSMATLQKCVQEAQEAA